MLLSFTVFPCPINFHISAMELLKSEIYLHFIVPSSNYHVEPSMSHCSLYWSHLSPHPEEVVITEHKTQGPIYSISDLKLDLKLNYMYA